MKKVGVLMEELGFRKDAPESVKEAFLASLKRTLTEEEKVKLDMKAIETSMKCPVVKSVLPEQLSFFETETPQSLAASGKNKRKQAG